MWRAFSRYSPLLTAHVPGAAGQPHDRFWGGHFVQEDRGDHLAETIVRWLGT
jgi:haloalkane dehalogenase